jgi:hypothetical protein
MDFFDFFEKTHFLNVIVLKLFYGQFICSNSNVYLFIAMSI